MGKYIFVVFFSENVRHFCMYKKTQCYQTKKWKFENKTERVFVVSRCLINQRKIFCQTCNKCNECRDLLSLLRRYHEIEFEVQKIPGNYIVYLEFNKLQNYLQLEYAKIFHTINEAKEMGAFLFKKKKKKKTLKTSF